MPERLYLDLETFSAIPIRNGVHAYAERAEILLFAWAIDNDPIHVWDMTTNTKIPLELRTALKNPEVEVWAHNSHFDRTLLRHCLPDLTPDIPRWRDTMVRALAFRYRRRRRKYPAKVIPITARR